MIYNLNFHRRKNIRLKGYDYSQAGLYFITICVHNMKCIYGKIVDEGMILNDYGIIAYNEWLKLPERFPNMELDVFQIMPNHMHGIIALKKNPVPSTLAVDNTVANIESKIIPTNETDIHSESNGTKAGASPDPTDPPDTPKTIGDIVGASKSLVANECLKIFIQTKIDEGFAPDKIPKMGKIWQSNFYEHIIRDDLAYLRISEYIINNPKNWKGDKFYER